MDEHEILDLKSQVDRETAANEAEHNSFKRRLNALEAAEKERTEMLLAIQSLGDAVKNVSTKVGEIAVSVNKVEQRVDEIESEPGDQYKKLKYEIIKCVVLAIVGVAIGYFIK